MLVGLFPGDVRADLAGVLAASVRRSSTRKVEKGALTNGGGEIGNERRQARRAQGQVRQAVIGRFGGRGWACLDHDGSS